MKDYGFVFPTLAYLYCAWMLWVYVQASEIRAPDNPPRRKRKAGRR